MLSIGAGVTGIMNAYHIQKFCENVEHVIYEKNPDIGGTWLENRYPGTYDLCFRAEWSVVDGVWALRRHSGLMTQQFRMETLSLP